MSANAMRVLSLGGGTQSCALALMSAAGDLPKLDHIVFADTQGELPETYEYIEYLRGVVEPVGIPLHVVTAGSLEDALLGRVDRLTVNPSPPAHLDTVAENGERKKGRLSSYKCSYDYKRRQVNRKIKELCGGRGAWKRSNVQQWIGYSLDELGRMKQADECRCGHNRAVGSGKKAKLIHSTAGCERCDCAAFDPWLSNVWPLIDLRMKRDDTIRWFAAHGHPTPPRSACWFCPNSGNERWQLLRSEKPDLFERACVIDETIRDVGDFKNHANRVLADGTKLYLHASLVPLRHADLRTAHQRTVDEGQGELFDIDTLALDCQAGVCFT